MEFGEKWRHENINSLSFTILIRFQILKKRIITYIVIMFPYIFEVRTRGFRVHKYTFFVFRIVIKNKPKSFA